METEITVYIVVLLNVLVQESESAYGNCWSGIVGDGGQYYGTLAFTTSGKICQPWASQNPHPHTYTSDALFPFDTAVALANNYCRDPDFNYRPWCYTMDPFTEWDFCDAPVCINRACEPNVDTGVVDTGTLASFGIVDTIAGINYLITDKWFSFHCCGTVSTWCFHVMSAGTIHLQVWRLDRTTAEYVLKGENVFIYNAGHADTVQCETISLPFRISVEDGDKIGWYSTTAGMISSDNWGGNNNLLLSTTLPSVGQSESFGAATVVNNRDYAVGAKVAQNLAPYFNNAITTVSITETTSVGTPIYSVIYTDDDPDDVATLKINMLTPSLYFRLNTALSVIEVKSTLAVGTYPLRLLVTDHCIDSGIITITVTVTKKPVVITNIPNFANVSESETTETPVYTLTFASTGAHTCTIPSYTPVRPEGNPFITKHTPTSDIGIYLKSDAAVRYAVTTSYDVIITCTDGITSDTNNLTVNIMPNSKPVFENWIASKNISTLTTRSGHTVYTANVTDAENDPITMSIVSCLPIPCIFDVNNHFEIYTTKDLYLHEVPSYDIVLSADDGFTTVTSPLLTITIADINMRPVFTNIPVTIHILEDMAIGTEIFNVSQYDAEGDPPTFLFTGFSPAACSSLYRLSATDGRITTVPYLDFDTAAVTTCALNVTVNDGKAFSLTDTINIVITDIDEPPVFSSSHYRISTQEVLSGTLFDAGITVPDPEGTAVTLTLDCGDDSGYLLIDSTTRLLNMSTEYELDPDLSNHTIECNITATDATSQTTQASLACEITDANDNTPVFASGMYTVRIQNTQELGVIGSARATDDDSTSPNNHIAYTVTGSPKFDIDADGNIILIGNVTGDTSLTLYTLTVTATDAGTGNLASTVTFQVFVSEAAVPTVGSQPTGFLSSALNALLFAIGVSLGTLVVIVTGYLIYRFCCKTKPPFFDITRVKPKRKLNKENQTELPVTPRKDKSILSKRRPSDESTVTESNRPTSVDSGINISLQTPPVKTNIAPMFMEKGPSESKEPNRPSTANSTMSDVSIKPQTMSISTIYNPLFAEKGLNSAPNASRNTPPPAKHGKRKFVTRIFSDPSKQIDSIRPSSNDSFRTPSPPVVTTDQPIFVEKAIAEPSLSNIPNRPASNESGTTVLLEKPPESTSTQPMFVEKGPEESSESKIPSRPISNDSGTILSLKKPPGNTKVPPMFVEKGLIDTSKPKVPSRPINKGSGTTGSAQTSQGGTNMQHMFLEKGHADLSQQKVLSRPNRNDSDTTVRLTPQVSISKRYTIEKGRANLQSKLKQFSRTLSNDSLISVSSKEATDNTNFMPLFPGHSKLHDRNRHISNDSGIAVSPKSPPANTHFHPISSKPSNTFFEDH